MDLDQCKTESTRLGPWAYLSTVRPGGKPHVVPVHPCWDRERLAVFTGAASQKVRNIRTDPSYSLHYTVGPDTGFDHLIIEGSASVVTDPAEKERLWPVMDYPLEQFGGAGGPDDPTSAFLSLDVERVVFLKMMGTQGREVWRS